MSLSPFPLPGRDGNGEPGRSSRSPPEPYPSRLEAILIRPKQLVLQACTLPTKYFLLIHCCWKARRRNPGQAFRRLLDYLRPKDQTAHLLE